MTSVLVVGGGLAGLSCAWRLQQSGHSVEVLERQSEVGGNVRSRRHTVDGQDFELACGFRAHRPNDENLRTLITSLGRANDLRPVPHADVGVLADDGSFARLEGEGAMAAMRSRALGSRARLGLARLAFDRSRYRRLLDPRQPERAAPLDRQNLASYLERTAGRSVARAQIEPILALALRSRLEHISDAHGLLWLERRARGPRFESIVGGLGGFALSLGEALRVRRSIEVVRVESTGGGVRVRYRGGGRDRSALADIAVIAVPGPQVPSLCPQLLPAERSFFDGMRYTRGIEVHLLMASRPALPAYQVALPGTRSDGVAGFIADHELTGAAPEDAGLVRVVIAEVEVDRLWRASDEVLGDLARAALERVAGRCKVLAAVVDRLPTVASQFRPGTHVRLAGFCERAARTPCLAFAGDYLVAPYAEGAVISGLRAARSVALLLASPEAAGKVMEQRAEAL